MQPHPNELFFQNIDVSGSLENALNTKVLETTELEFLSEN